MDLATKNMNNYAIFKDKNWPWLKFDGRKKIFHGMTKDDFFAAKERHFAHLRANDGSALICRCQSFELLDFLIQRVGTKHEKVIIEGDEHLYIASPIYGHADYNICYFAKNTPHNRRKADLINSLLAKTRLIKRLHTK